MVSAHDRTDRHSVCTACVLSSFFFFPANCFASAHSHLKCKRVSSFYIDITVLADGKLRVFIIGMYTHVVLCCIGWLMRAFSNWKKRKWRRTEKERQIKIKTITKYRCIVAWNGWHGIQYKFQIYCFHLLLEQESNHIAFKWVLMTIKQNTCQTLNWLSDQFALTNRIRLCLPIRNDFTLWLKRSARRVG